MRKNNEWEQRFGAKRRAIDRDILAEAERWEAPPLPQDGRIEFSAPKIAPNGSKLALDARSTIARAFGRPLN